MIANVTGELYPTDPEQVKDYLERQIASPVQWAKGLETLYDHGVRVFMEVGPKKVLKGFVDNVLAGRADLVSLFTNHPDFGEIAMFNQALCGLYAAGVTPADANRQSAPPVTDALHARPRSGPGMSPLRRHVRRQRSIAPRPSPPEESMTPTQSPDAVNALAQLLAQALSAPA